MNSSSSSRILSAMRVLRWRPSQRAEKILLALAVLIFFAISFVAYRSLPQIRVHWVPLGVLASLSAPGMVTLNSIEYLILARMLHQRVPVWTAVRISLLSAAANLLPLPGAALVRIKALSLRGSSLGKATAAASTIGLAWVGLTGLLAGIVQSALGNRLIGLGAFAGGILFLGSTWILVRLTVGRSRALGNFTRILITEALFVAQLTLQFFLALHAIGFDVSIAQSAMFTIPAVAAAAIGFLPGGLGLRELLAAGISPLVGLPPEAGVLATLLDRVVAAAVLGVIGAGTMLGPSAPSSGSNGPDGGDSM